MNAWEIEFDEEAEKDLIRLAPDVHGRIIEKLNWLRSNFTSITPLPLHANWQGYYKLRVGDWRVVYDIDWTAYLLTIVMIGHRTKIYKRIK